MRVWRAAPEEAAEVSRLLIAFRDWMGRTGEEPPDDALRASVERLIGRDDTEYLLGALGDDEPPAGVAQLRFRWGVWWAAEDCLLEDLFVEEAARRGGLGRALVEATIERARERRCRRLELDVNSENTAAVALYRSLAFDTGRTGGQDLLMRRRV